MIYEIRIYRCVPMRLPALLKRFENTTLELWKKHGIRQAGFWTTLVGETIDRLLADVPFGDLLPRDDLTSAVAALFLGIELLTGLDPGMASGSLFTTMETVATLVDGLLRGAPPAAAAN